LAIAAASVLVGKANIVDLEVDDHNAK